MGKLVAMSSKCIKKYKILYVVLKEENGTELLKNHHRDEVSRREIKQCYTRGTQVHCISSVSQMEHTPALK